MKISQATALIRTPLIEWARPQSWCDLGCGSGTFTTALAQLLAPGSTIHAVDLDQRALDEIPEQYDGVEIRKMVADLQSTTYLQASLPASGTPMNMKVAGGHRDCSGRTRGAKQRPELNRHQKQKAAARPQQRQIW